MRAPFVVVALSTCAIAAAAGCEKKAAEPADAGAPLAVPALPQPPPAPSATALPPAPDSDGGALRLALSDHTKVTDWVQKTVKPLLEKEAKSRPSGTPRVDAALTAFEKAGIQVKVRNQALASVVGAAYCVGSRTATMLGLMLCEYPDEAAAKKGRESTLLLFGKAMPMEIVVNRKTTLAITNVTKTSDANAESKKLAEIFGQLPGS